MTSQGTQTFALRDVALMRGGRTIVRDVNLTGRPGELLVLRGPSGSGKTTILRAMAGLDPFDAGTIDVGNATLQSGAAPAAGILQRVRRQVGFVFQFHCLFEHLTALENVMLSPIHVHKKPQREAEQRARALLSQLGVEARASALPRQLSGGEAQRVAIARALAVDPPVLLMDEPMASLDPGRRAELGALLQELTRAGRTLLVTSHDEAFVQHFATRILTIDNERVTST